MTRRLLRLLLGVGLLGAGVLLLSQRPADADDCKSKVTSLSDLNDPAAVQDCIRTGAGWATVVGITVAATGAVIAWAGMPRSRTKPPPLPEGQQAPLDPCAAKAFWRNRLTELSSYQKTLGDIITNEFHQYSTESDALANLYAEIKKSQYWVGLARYRAAWMTAGGWGVMIAGAVGAAKVALAAAPVAGAATPMTQILPTALGGGSVATSTSEAIGLFGAGAAPPYSTVPYFPENMGFDTGADPWLQRINPLTAGSAEQQRALLELGQCGNVYLENAKAFNQRMSTWAMERQADVNRLQSELHGAFDKLQESFAACPDTASGVLEGIRDGWRSMWGQLPSKLLGDQAVAGGADLTIHFPRLPTDRNELMSTGPWFPTGWSPFR